MSNLYIVLWCTKSIYETVDLVCSCKLLLNVKIRCFLLNAKCFLNLLNSFKDVNRLCALG